MDPTVPDRAGAPEQKAALIRDRMLASETERVGSWVDALARCIEARRVNERDDAAFHKLEADLDAITQSCLDAVGDLRISVEESGLIFEGRCVYHRAVPEGSLSVALFNEGVREIILHWGLESEELRTFVDVMRSAMCGRVQGPDDIVTLLWEKNFRHIEIVCVPFEEWEPEPRAGGDEGASSEADGGMPWPAEAHAQREAETDSGGPVEERSDDWSLPLGTAPALNQTLGSQFRFGEIEAANVRMVATIEGASSPREEVLKILSAILAAEEETAEYLETASIIGSLVEQAVLEGDLRGANQLIDRLRGISAAKATAPGEFQAAADQVIRDIGRHDFLGRLGPVLTAHREIDLDALTTFLANLGPSAAPTLCDLLGEIEEMKIRRALCEALAISCKNDVNVLIKRLSDPRWFVVRNILYILGQIAHQGVERALGDALYHEDVRVRKEAVRGLREIDSPSSRAYLNSALRDLDKSVRILVAHSITKRGDERAARIIWSVIESPEFASRDAEERRTFFEALGRSGTDALVPRLERMLTSGGLFRAEGQEGRKDAALALAWLGTPAALAVLNRELKSKRDAVREAVEGALEMVRKAALQNRQAERGTTDPPRG